MNVASNTEKRVYEFLINELGYPQESITSGIHYKDDNIFYIPDFVIVNTITNNILFIIEVKTYLDIHIMKINFTKINKTEKFKNIPKYIFIVNDKNIDIKLFKDGDFIDINQDLIKFNNILSSDIFNIKTNNKESIIEFKNICIISSIILFLIFIIDVFTGYILEYTILTIERIIFIGLSIGLLLFPYIQKIKISGFEIEQIKQNSQ